MSNEHTPADFETALAGFRSIAEATVLAYYAKMEYTHEVPGVEIVASRGKRYAKLIQLPCGSVHSFVELTTGDIFKPASFKAPAKHARGNIYDADNGLSSLSEQGSIVYLR